MTEEFPHPDVERLKRAGDARGAAARELASVYARVFGSEDGARVLADLRLKFGHHRPRFTLTNGRHDTIAAAKIDGQCDVLREIEEAIKASPVPIPNHP
jgi:hypothetical protein